MNRIGLMLVMTAVACSDATSAGTSNTPSATACVPAGTYRLTRTRDTAAPGTCSIGAALADSVVTIATNASTVTLSFDTAATYECTGTLNGCELKTTCKIITSDASAVINEAFTWTFDPNGFSGSSEMTIISADTGAQCVARFINSGTRQ
jgi:hypothetical protein